jgi:transposase
MAQFLWTTAQEQLGMMGSRDDHQDQFFYAFKLDDYVPQDHLLRRIDAVLDLSDLRQHLAPYYSHTGRPSVDPELMVRMLIVGYCYGIRSERRLCEEVKLNLAYRWFCRLSIEDPVPDHSTFSKARHGRFRDSDTLRFVFDQVLGAGIEAGLVGGEGFAVDASLVEADVARHRAISRDDDDDDWPSAHGAKRAVREYLESLDGEAPEARRISPADPAARWTVSRRENRLFAYSTNYLMDVDAGLIVDVEATPAYRTDEVNAVRTMIERVEERFDIKPERLAADTAYGTAAILGWLVKDKAITPHVPVWDKSEGKAELYGRADFTWEADADCYRCPGGKTLERGRRKSRTPRAGVTKANTIIYRALQRDCEACALKSRCCPNTPHRKIARSIHEDARDLARALSKTEAYAQSLKERKRVEQLFGNMKRVLKLDRLRLRGLSGAHDEFLLAATAQNLRRMARLLPTGPPDYGVAAAV